MTETPTAPAQARRVVLIEDDAPIRERVAAALGKKGDLCVEQAATLAEARAAIAREAAALIVSDLRLPDGLAVDFLAEVRSSSPSTEILVISVLGDEATILAAIAAGASGYLLKDAMPDDIHAAALDVLNGGSPISPSIARFIVMRARQGAEAKTTGPTEDAPRLTPRELDILWGIAKGFTYAEIAERLGMSKQTVPTHIKAIYRKLQVDTRGAAVFEAVQYGLIKL